MARGVGPAQIFQMLAAQKERLRQEAESLEKLEKMIINVYGKPNADFEA